ncbi:glycosyl transferase, partial [Salmonella enterica subsp. enterica serovar Derby]|nr:glycosyl transferase [Salmonella enterica subsp. enterica serovar Derby]
TLTALHAGIPQIVFGQGADRPVNARAVVERGCGIIPGKSGLTSSMINTFLGNRALREASQEVAAEMAAQPCPTEVAKKLIAMLQHG